MKSVALEDLILMTPEEPTVAAGALLVRNALEPLVTAEAVRYCDAADLDELEALVGDMEAKRDAPEAFLRANWALHRRLARIVRNPVLARVYESTLDLAEARIAGVGAGTHFAARVPRTVAVHAELVAAIAGREPEAAADATARHAPLVRALA